MWFLQQIDEFGEFQMSLAPYDYLMAIIYTLLAVLILPYVADQIVTKAERKLDKTEET